MTEDGLRPFGKAKFVADKEKDKDEVGSGRRKIDRVTKKSEKVDKPTHPETEKDK